MMGQLFCHDGDSHEPEISCLNARPTLQLKRSLPAALRHVTSTANPRTKYFYIVGRFAKGAARLTLWFSNSSILITLFSAGMESAEHSMSPQQECER